jgi:hypothetical protein
MKKFSVVALLVGLLLFIPNANAQLTTSTTVGITVNVSISSTISLSEVGTLTINPATGVSNNVTFNTTWNLGPTSSVTLYTWFSNPASALSAGASNIPSSALSATFSVPATSSGSGQPCNQSPAVGNGVTDGSACQAALLASVGSGGVSMGSNNIQTSPVAATYSLSILNYQALRLPAGNFSGVLNALVLAV